MILILTLFALLVLILAAPHWGVSTVDSFDSPEWERRLAWRGFGRYYSTAFLSPSMY